MPNLIHLKEAWFPKSDEHLRSENQDLLGTSVWPTKNYATQIVSHICKSRPYNTLTFQKGSEDALQTVSIQHQNTYKKYPGNFNDHLIKTSAPHPFETAQWLQVYGVKVLLH